MVESWNRQPNWISRPKNHPHSNPNQTSCHVLALNHHRENLRPQAFAHFRETCHGGGDGNRWDFAGRLHRRTNSKIRLCKTTDCACTYSNSWYTRKAFRSMAASGKREMNMGDWYRLCVWCVSKFLWVRCWQRWTGVLSAIYINS